MNKKLLGIAAVALLGVSAAFAATTSTVYFTASGTLTKVLNPLDGLVEIEGESSESAHNKEYSIGISRVYDTIGTKSTYDTTNVTAKYQGEALTSGTINAKHSLKSRVANTSTDSTFLSKAPYIYHEIYISGLNFEQAGDYYLIPFEIANFDKIDHTWGGMYDYKIDGYDQWVYYSPYTNLTVQDSTNSELTCSNLKYRFIMVDNTGYCKTSLTETVLNDLDYGSDDNMTGSFGFYDISYKKIYKGFLEIKLTEDNTSSTINFKSAKIETEFDKTWTN